MRTRARAEDLANGGRSHGSAAAREEEGADGWDLPVSVLQREGEGRSDGRDPPVSDRVQRESARAAPAWAEREWAGLRAGFQAARCAVAFSFFFLSNFALYLILHIKLCIDSKIMKIFVYIP